MKKPPPVTVPWAESMDRLPRADAPWTPEELACLRRAIETNANISAVARQWATWFPETPRTVEAIRMKRCRMM